MQDAVQLLVLLILALGMHGAFWDIYITVTLALAGASPRTLYAHPSSKGKLERITDLTDDERAVALAALRTRGGSEDQRR